MFVWNLEEGRVTEQMVVTIPATPGNIFPGLNVQSKYGECEEMSCEMICQITRELKCGSCAISPLTLTTL